jgi:signal transduction histidine kinase
MFDRLDESERREFFTLIDSEAARLMRVVEQASAALKVDANQLVYLLNEEELGILVEKVAWASPHGDHPMSIETDPGIVVRADRRYLTEVIGNVVENAAKFSPPDAPIDVTVRRGGDRSAVIEIADRGPGIPPERAEQVFERFGSWRPAGYEETPGAGLGLFLARAHVLAHSGHVDVAEREEGGTILRITLPAETAD